MSGCTFLFILSLFSPRSAGGLFFGCTINGLGKDSGKMYLSIEDGKVDLVTNESTRSVSISPT